MEPTGRTQQVGIVEAYRAGLGQEERTRSLLTHMVFPRTNSLERDKPLVTAHYICDGVQQCSFKAARETVTNNTELRAYGGVTTTALALIEAIENNQADFIPHALDGFVLNRCGYDLLRLQRTSSTLEGRTGHLEYNDIRAEAIHRGETARRVAAELVLVKSLDKVISSSKQEVSCSIM